MITGINQQETGVSSHRCHFLGVFSPENGGRTNQIWAFYRWFGDFNVPGLVNVYMTNWKTHPFLSSVNQL
jgi:hypothetical protein